MKKRFFSLVMALFLCAGLAAPASAANGAALDYKVNTKDGPIRFLTAAERDEERMKIAQSIKEDGGTVITQQETPTDPHCQERLKAMEETLKGGGMAAAQPETPTRIPANGSYYTSTNPIIWGCILCVFIGKIFAILLMFHLLFSAVNFLSIKIVS